MVRHHHCSPLPRSYKRTTLVHGLQIPSRHLPFPSAAIFAGCPRPFSLPLSPPKIIERTREDCNFRQALRHREGISMSQAGEVPQVVE